jgi:hypothetical protein
MGDRSYFQVHVYDCPEDQREAARLVIADYVTAAAEDHVLDLTEAYTEEEVSCGSADELAPRLEEAAPGCSFVLWEDPTYVWLGSIRARTPALGSFAADCDAHGHPVFTLSEVMAVLKSDQVTACDDPDNSDGMLLKGVPAALARAFGDPWLEDWRAHAGSENADGDTLIAGAVYGPDGHEA